MRETAMASEKNNGNNCRGEGGRGEGRRREERKKQARRGEEERDLWIKHQMFGTDNRHKETSVCSVSDVFRDICAASLSECSVFEYVSDQNCRIRFGSNSRNTFSIE